MKTQPKRKSLVDTDTSDGKRKSPDREKTERSQT